MSMYYACCLFIFSVFGVAILIDPVIAAYFARPVENFKRLCFFFYYMGATSPRLVVFLTMNWPLTSIKYYTNLLKQFKSVFPECFDEQGNFIDMDDN